MQKIGVLKIYTKFTEEQPCQSAISIKFQSKFIEITLRHVCSIGNLLYVFLRTPFLKSNYERLLLLLYRRRTQGTCSENICAAENSSGKVIGLKRQSCPPFRELTFFEIYKKLSNIFAIYSKPVPRVPLQNSKYLPVYESCLFA